MEKIVEANKIYIIGITFSNLIKFVYNNGVLLFFNDMISDNQQV